ncbi:MAG: hypothetical protein B5766_08210 [Candidatus Lumbricidophila eiseniae]|uniref:Uncharacterized protein n=1 Tax=Candidatus Lumbricidiphila eiseniae TaxID=1969409 RepID=A0A2A6FRC5_9MICO|nr:MAG: hypothetical protein B5766_08210 [Candidatus Lumbricidophila eiseniae]
MLSAQMFVDYQNLHLSAHGTFTPYGTPVHEALIHPGRFADQVIAGWKDDPVSIKQIHVFRGLPNSRREPDANSRVNRQHNQWKRDPRVIIQTGS